MRASVRRLLPNRNLSRTEVDALRAVPGDGEQAGLHRGRLIAVTIAIMLALLLVGLDQTIVGTAMPRIVAQLQGLDYYAWVVTAYMVTSTTMTPIAGKLGDLFGRKPFLLAGMVGFVLASALCGLSQSMLELVIFRSVQGLFGGILFATVFAVIADIFPAEQRPRMQGVLAAIVGTAAVLGPTAGGYLTDNFTWRSVFFVNLPVGVLAVPTVALVMPAVRHAGSWRDIDFRGAVALAASLVPLLVALSITRDHAWTSPEVLGLLALAAVMLPTFAVLEARDPHPIVPLTLFRNRTFAVSVITGFFTSFAMFGTVLFVPLLLQGVLGATATNSGELLTPMMLGLVVAAVISGQAITMVHRYRFVGTFGIGLMIAGIWLLSQVTVDSPSGEVVRDIVIVGLGLGTVFPLYMNAVQSAVPARFVGVVSSQIQFWRNVGGTVGSAILGSVLAHRLPDQIRTQVSALDLPPQARQLLGSAAAGNTHQFLDPTQLAAARAALPPQLAPLFDQLVHAVRVALANTLHELFLYGATILVLALIASVFLDDVPLRSRKEVEAAQAAAPPEVAA